MATTHDSPLFASSSKTAAQLQKYYSSLESRIGYHVVLGGTRHLGYYPPGTHWPFPITPALRRMESHLYTTLSLPPGSKVLDAGCGNGHVAIHMAQRGLHVQGIDITPAHLHQAHQTIAASGHADKIGLTLADYHDLTPLPASSFDGAYTLETLVHAHDAPRVLSQLHRLLKPSGTLALYEYDHIDFAHPPHDRALQKLIAGITAVNIDGCMPSNHRFARGVLRRMLEEAGFEAVATTDLSENVKPMLKLFYVMAFVPWLVICALGLQARFVNTRAGVVAWPAVERGVQRMVCVRARKPGRRSGGGGEGEEGGDSVEE